MALAVGIFADIGLWVADVEWDLSKKVKAEVEKLLKEIQERHGQVYDGPPMPGERYYSESIIGESSDPNDWQ